MHSVSRRTGLIRVARLAGVMGALLVAVHATDVRAQVAGGAQPSAAVDTPSARIVGTLRSGDLLKIHVYRDEELSGEYLIDSRGTLQIPGIGVVRAAGYDPSEVKERLIAALRERGFSHPEIAVQPLVRVSVLGEVRMPQLYSVDPGTSLLQLVSVAGGPTERANIERVRVVRDGRAFNVDLESAFQGSATGRIVLNSNDVVYIPRKRGFTRETLAFALTTVTAVLSLITLLSNR
jgi:protein involved in polysaccharide export with SLBB domain